MRKFNKRYFIFMGALTLVIAAGFFFIKLNAQAGEYDYKDHISTHVEITDEVEEMIGEDSPDPNATNALAINFDAIGIINEKLPTADYGLSWVIEDFYTGEKFIIVDEMSEDQLKHFFEGLLVEITGWKQEKMINGLPVIELDDMKFAFAASRDKKESIKHSHEHLTKEEFKQKIQGIKINKNEFPNYLEFEILGENHILSGESIGFSMYYTDENGNQNNFYPEEIIGGYNWYEDKFIVKTWGYQDNLKDLKIALKTYIYVEDLMIIDLIPLLK